MSRYLEAYGKAISEGCTSIQALEAGLEAERQDCDLRMGTKEFGFPCRIYATRVGPPKPHPVYFMMRAAYKAGRTVTLIEEGRIENFRRTA